MRDFINISSLPIEEECAQVGNFCSEYCAEKAIDWEDDENEEMTRV